VPERVAVSLGDPSGIGPEIAASALAALRREVVPLVFGDASFVRRARAAGLALPVVPPGTPFPAGGALVPVTRLPAAQRRPGHPAPAGGRAQLAFLAAAFAAVRAGAK